MKQLKFGHTSKSSGWHSTLTIRHPDEIQPGANSSGWLRVWITLRRPDDIGQHNTSPEWYPALTISHPHGIRPGANPSRWLMTNEVCHLDDISYHQMLSGWLTAMLSCHPKKWIRVNDLRYKLYKLGLTTKTWRLIRECYRDFRCSAFIAWKVAEWFIPERGSNKAHHCLWRFIGSTLMTCSRSSGPASMGHT